MLWKVGEILSNQHLRRLMGPRQSILRHNYSCVPFPFLISFIHLLRPFILDFFFDVPSRFYPKVYEIIQCSHFLPEKVIIIFKSSIHL